MFEMHLIESDSFTVFRFVLIGLIFATTVYELMGLLAVSGIGEAGRYYVAYVYVIEIFHTKY